MAPAWKRAKSLGQKSHIEREELCRLNEWIMRLQLMSRFTSSTQQEAGHKNKVSLLEPALYSLQMGELSQGTKSMTPPIFDKKHASWVKPRSWPRKTHWYSALAFGSSCAEGFLVTLDWGPFSWNSSALWAGLPQARLFLPHCTPWLLLLAQWSEK